MRESCAAAMMRALTLRARSALGSDALPATRNSSTPSTVTGAESIAGCASTRLGSSASAAASSSRDATVAISLAVSISSEAPGARQPQHVRVVDLVDVHQLVLELRVEVLEEGDARADAVHDRLAVVVAFDDVAVARTDVLEVDLQVDVMEVVTDLGRQLEDAERQRADQVAGKSRQLHLVVAARAGRIEVATWIAEVDVVRLERDVRVEAPPEPHLPGGVIAIQVLQHVVHALEAVELDVELADARGDVRARKILLVLGLRRTGAGESEEGRGCRERTKNSAGRKHGRPLVHAHGAWRADLQLWFQLALARIRGTYAQGVCSAAR